MCARKSKPYIIDCHTHAWTPEDWAMLKELAPAMDDPDLEEDSPYNWTPRFEGTVPSLIKQEKAAGIDRFVLLPTSSRPERSPELTRWVADLARHYPEIIAFGALHPYSESLDRDVAEITALGLPGIKIHSLVQRLDPLSDKALKAFDLVEKANLIVLMDSMSIRGAAAVKPNLAAWMKEAEALKIDTNPEKIAELVRRYPKLKIIAAHMGCLYGWHMLDPIMDLDQVYFDISYVHRLITPELAMDLIRKKGPERIIFGTDAPYRQPDKALAWFMNLPLTPGEQERILGLNFFKLMGSENTI
jgi:predicted TIM-barrel fold metal-dependent hydrolase